MLELQPLSNPTFKDNGTETQPTARIDRVHRNEGAQRWSGSVQEPRADVGTSDTPASPF
jgi:hypothetical protein